MADVSEYAVKVNENNKTVELNLLPSKLGRDVKHGAHLRASWASTVSFLLAFVGWFALAPIAIDVATVRTRSTRQRSTRGARPSEVQDCRREHSY
jgi:hypothetical protein